MDLRSEFDMAIELQNSFSKLNHITTLATDEIMGVDEDFILATLPRNNDEPDRRSVHRNAWEMLDWVLRNEANVNATRPYVLVRMEECMEMALNGKTVKDLIKEYHENKYDEIGPSTPRTF